ncbi:MAG: hypothetical protein K2H86_01960 [Muribaculaceae bacterium]|nr:hypothetical protein [Muribaculaceae bacterium]
MNIKSKIFMLTAVGGAMLLGGCNLDNDGTSVFVDVALCNIVIPTDADQPVTAQSNVKYKVVYNLGKATATVSSEPMAIGGQNISLQSDPMSFTEKIASSGYARNFSGAGTMSDGVGVTSLKGAESTLFYYYPTAVPGVIGVNPINNRLCLSYEIGSDYKVKTIPQDLYFAGETVTHYSFQGQDGLSYTCKDAFYRVCFSDDMKSATVVLYNIQFASQMGTPIKAICLKDLKVNYSPAGYTVTGVDVVPLVSQQDGVVIEYKNFTFDSFTLQSTGEMLTKCICNYTVHGIYHGAFEGSYMVY